MRKLRAASATAVAMVLLLLCLLDGCQGIIERRGFPWRKWPPQQRCSGSAIKCSTDYDCTRKCGRGSSCIGCPDCSGKINGQCYPRGLQPAIFCAEPLCPKPLPKPLPLPKPEPCEFGNDCGVTPGKLCRKTGCSSHICSDSDVVSTCEFRPEYACYRTATCTRQSDGQCGWVQTPELQKCLSDNRGSGSTIFSTLD